MCSHKTGEFKKNTTVTRKNHSMVAVIKTYSPISTKGERKDLGVTELEKTWFKKKSKQNEESINSNSNLSVKYRGLQPKL